MLKILSTFVFVCLFAVAADAARADRQGYIAGTYDYFDKVKLGRKTQCIMFVKTKFQFNSPDGRPNGDREKTWGMVAPNATCTSQASVGDQVLIKRDAYTRFAGAGQRGKLETLQDYEFPDNPFFVEIKDANEIKKETSLQAKIDAAQIVNDLPETEGSLCLVKLTVENSKYGVLMDEGKCTQNGYVQGKNVSLTFSNLSYFSSGAQIGALQNLDSNYFYLILPDENDTL